MTMEPEVVTGPPDATKPLGIIKPIFVTVPLLAVAPEATPESLAASAEEKAWMPLA